MISIIIPVINEADNLNRLLPVLRSSLVPHEVIVVDGGSTDGSDAVAEQHGATALSAPRGRGTQLQAGVAVSSGQTLLFLHADTDFDTRGLAAMVCALGANPNLVGGNFLVIFEGDREFCQDLTRFYAWMRRRGNYYGDSAIFVRRSVYDRLGGIRGIPLMEDYDFVRRMERAGRTICIQEPPVITSSRRFEGRTWPNIVWGWIKMHALYALGVSPARLARMYEALK